MLGVCIVVDGQHDRVGQLASTRQGHVVVPTQQGSINQLINQRSTIGPMDSCVAQIN